LMVFVATHDRPAEKAEGVEPLVAPTETA